MTRFSIRKSAPLLVDGTAPIRLRVTPHEDDMRALERKRSQLSYVPQNGFHADQVQQRRSEQK